MSLEFFEPRPPKSAAIKLDFLKNPDPEVAETLCAMPGVDDVAIEYGQRGRRVVINPHGDLPRTLDVSDEDWWLVCTPPPPSTQFRAFGSVELELVPDRLFHRIYRSSETVDVESLP